MTPYTLQRQSSSVMKEALFRKCMHKELDPLTANVFNRNFHPLEVVSRWRDPQLQVGENYSDLVNDLEILFIDLM